MQSPITCEIVNGKKTTMSTVNPILLWSLYFLFWELAVRIMGHKIKVVVLAAAV